MLKGEDRFFKAFRTEKGTMREVRWLKGFPRTSSDNSPHLPRRDTLLVGPVTFGSATKRTCNLSRPTVPRASAAAMLAFFGNWLAATRAVPWNTVASSVRLLRSRCFSAGVPTQPSGLFRCSNVISSISSSAALDIQSRPGIAPAGSSSRALEVRAMLVKSSKNWSSVKTPTDVTNKSRPWDKTDLPYSRTQGWPAASTQRDQSAARNSWMLLASTFSSHLWRWG